MKAASRRATAAAGPAGTARASTGRRASSTRSAGTAKPASTAQARATKRPSETTRPSGTTGPADTTGLAGTTRRADTTRPAEAGCDPVTDCLLIQVAAKEPAEVLRLADRAGSGLVFTGAGAIEAASAARRHGLEVPMLADRRRYAGATRVPGTARFVPSWLAGQRDAGMRPVLTDSGYIGQGDRAALRSVLRQAAKAGPDVTAVLPLQERWLREDRGTLIAEVTGHDVPVALVLEHPDDPLADPEAVAGLVELLHRAPSVALLGTGIAGLAALAFGATWAAVGVRGSLQRFTPAADGADSPPKRRRWRPAPQEIVAAPVLSFHPIGMVTSASAASGGNPAWACRCSRCHGRTPDWLASAPALDADEHTFDVLLRHAERLRRREAGPAREQAWRTQCRQAMAHYRDLGLAERGWRQPGVITAGAALTAHRAPLRSAG